MPNSYLKMAVRNFRRNKVFTAINILGLAIGISASLVIYLIVQHELSYEKGWKDSEKIQRVVSEISFPGVTMNNSGVPAPLADAVRQEVTGVDAVTHFLTVYQDDIEIPAEGQRPSQKFRREKDIIFADSVFFSFFPYHFVAGSATQSLQEPFTTVLTLSRAKAYFGDMAPAQILGKTLIISDTISTTITGIVKDLEMTSDFAEFKLFVSRSTIAQTSLKRRWSWSQWGSINSASQLFVKLKPGNTQANFLAQIKALREKYRERGPDAPATDEITHHLQPLTDLHFNTVYSAFGGRQAHRPTLAGLLAVALFLLLLGCINFVNLSTAQSFSRAKEIGIRKTLGSSKIALIRQFLVETLLLTLLATILSLLLMPWLLHVFSDFIPPEVQFSSVNQPKVWLFLAALLLVVTLLAGLYPAWVLTKFRPVTVLKNQLATDAGKTRKAWIRKTLTVTQFVVAQFLLIATLVVGKQIDYSVNKDLGYKRDAIVTLYTPFNFFASQEDNRRFALFNELNSMPALSMLSMGSDAPASNSTNSTTFTFQEGERKVELMAEVKTADTNYFRLFDMKLLAGRNLLPSDTAREYVINETFAKALGFQDPKEAVGKMIDRDGKKPIVGVLADFHTKSTHAAIEPLAYSASRENASSIIMLLPAGSKSEWTALIKKVETAFRKYFPDDEFNYSFFDDTVMNFYQSEQNMSRLLAWSTGLCLFISCLGLLGLVIFVTNSRTKEIGVRKVLGASVTQIVRLLSRDFLALVALAFLISMPLGWWAMNRWLEDFVYRTSIDWWIFAVTAAIMFAAAFLVLALRTFRAARNNPVKSLRTE